MAVSVNIHKDGGRLKILEEGEGKQFHLVSFLLNQSIVFQSVYVHFVCVQKLKGEGGSSSTVCNDLLPPPPPVPPGLILADRRQCYGPDVFHQMKTYARFIKAVSCFIKTLAEKTLGI